MQRSAWLISYSDKKKIHQHIRTKVLNNTSECWLIWNNYRARWYLHQSLNIQTGTHTFICVFNSHPLFFFPLAGSFTPQLNSFHFLKSSVVCVFHRQTPLVCYLQSYMQLKNEGKPRWWVLGWKMMAAWKSHWQADKTGIKLISIQGSKPLKDTNWAVRHTQIQYVSILSLCLSRENRRGHPRSFTSKHRFYTFNKLNPRLTT